MSISHKHNHNKDIKFKKITLKIYWLCRFPSSVSSPSAPPSPLRTPISTGSRGESSQVRIWETGPGCWRRTTVTWLGAPQLQQPLHPMSRPWPRYARAAPLAPGPRAFGTPGDPWDPAVAWRAPSTGWCAAEPSPPGRPGCMDGQYLLSWPLRPL